MSDQSAPQEKVATFAGGCFWCVEAVFERVDGVNKVVSGYTGGDVKNPSYREVSSGNTGHAEAVQITYDPSEVSYRELLEIFFKTHNPTTLNRQGADVGTQYRSEIFYHDPEQKKLAEYYIKKLDESDIYDDPIVTKLSEAGPFYEAEDYHQNYYEKNSSQGYCQIVIGPKLQKLKKLFSEKLKPEYQQ